MGVGSAIGVIGGAMQIGSGRAARKAAKKAAQQSEYYLNEGISAVEEGYKNAFDYMEQGGEYLDNVLDLSNSFKELMDTISQEYGDYAQQMFNDWENTFGGIRENLVDYYQNLDPVKYSTQAKAALGQQLDKSMEQFNEAAAQSGIYTSGMQLQAQKENAFQRAEAFAQADIMAPDQVAQMQNQFYGAYGEPMRQQASNMLGNSILQKGNLAGIGYNAQAGALGNMSNYYNNLANMSQQQGRDLSNVYLQAMGAYGNSASGYGAAAGNQMGMGMNNMLNGLFGGGGFMGMF